MNTMEMDIPECPVCLQVYDPHQVIPRVLACGHSLCQLCIVNLPSHDNFAGTIRCPQCNHLVPFPPQGPSALPKNIDLLRLVRTSANPKTSPGNGSDPHLKTLANSDFDDNCSNVRFARSFDASFYETWREYVIPSEAIEASSSSTTKGSDEFVDMQFEGRVMFSWRNWLKKDQEVSLLPVARDSSLSGSQRLRLSYMTRVMEMLNRLRKEQREELELLLKASMLRRRLSRTYGLWMDSDGVLMLVFERIAHHGSALDFDFLVDSDELQGGFSEHGLEMILRIGLELCEAFMELHAEGIAIGYLGPSCFGIDELGLVVLDLKNVLLIGRGIRMFLDQDCTFSDLVRAQKFLSPELFNALSNDLLPSRGGFSFSFKSDSWTLACVFLHLIFNQKSRIEEFFCTICSRSDETVVLKEKLAYIMELLNSNKQFEPLGYLLSKCLDYDTESRPDVIDIWRCMRTDLIESPWNSTVSGLVTQEEAVCCLVAGELLVLSNTVERTMQKMQKKSDSHLSSVETSGNGNTDGNDEGGSNMVPDMESLTLDGHHDCITGLAICGDYLLSSSFDKTIGVWSLKDFSHVQFLKGHGHRIVALLVVHAKETLCVSGDSGNNIFVWTISPVLVHEPIKKWSEHNDWRYSGVHALAASGANYLYSGSGDKSIKVWSLEDYTLICTMTGHKSAVSSMAVKDGILYSGSWDGTVRLWWINSHTPLAVLGDDASSSVSCVSALSVDHSILVASYENGSIKMWRNGVLLNSEQINGGAIVALEMRSKWLFTGGWDKIVNIHELQEREFDVDIRPVGVVDCDTVVTSLLYGNGKLFIGLSGKVIKMIFHH
ncbi:hypothetical protein AMTRI_Chr11g156340 [Amborella trichopoda]